MTTPKIHGDGSVTFVWAGDRRRFRLAPFGQLRELQELCDAGPMEILRCLQTGTWKVEYYREIIRLGLLGGGAKQVEVIRLLRDHVENAPPMECVPPARYILMGALTWPKEDDLGLGKEQPEETKTEGAETTANLSSPKSTAQEQPSVSPPVKSMNSPPGNLRRVSRATTRPKGQRRPRKHQTRPPLSI